MIYNLVISVVLYKTKLEYVKNIISCFENSTIDGVRLVFIDNSPEKTYLEEVFDKNSKIEYIFTGKNFGYGAGHNIAISKYIDESKYHLVLNPDIIFSENLLENVFERMENAKDIGLSSVKITFSDGKTQYVHRGNFSFVNWFCRVINYTVKKFLPGCEIFKDLVKRHELVDSYSEVEFYADCLSGCFMFFRNCALREIGFFNEKFFMYCEDVDISDRMLKCYKNKVFSDLSVIHIWQAESRKSIKMICVHVKSLVRYFFCF